MILSQFKNRAKLSDMSGFYFVKTPVLKPKRKNPCSLDWSNEWTILFYDGKGWIGADALQVKSSAWVLGSVDESEIIEISEKIEMPK